MPKEELPSDPNSVEKWRQLPQNTPSRDALPPVFGGGRIALSLVLIFGVVMLIVAIASLLNGGL